MIEKILAIIERETGITATESTPLEDLGTDSLEMMSLFAAFDIPNEAIADIHTVGDIVRYMERYDLCPN